MIQVGILEEFKKLTTTERLAIIETALHLIRKDLQQMEHQPTREERKRQLAVAAEALLSDYTSSRGELTIFTVLDSEDFFAER